MRAFLTWLGKLPQRLGIVVVLQATTPTGALASPWNAYPASSGYADKEEEGSELKGRR